MVRVVLFYGIIFPNTTPNVKHKAILLTAYSSGLRISEVLNLEISDIDSKNKLLRVRCGKGSKDRFTLLRQENLRLLRLYWKLYKPKVLLFPGLIPGKSLAPKNIQRVFQIAKEQAGISKPVSPFTSPQFRYPSAGKRY